MPVTLKLLALMFFHEETKHIEVNCHFVHHHVRYDTITILFVPSEDQGVDFFASSNTMVPTTGLQAFNAYQLPPRP